MFARAGLDLYLIQLLGRWGGRAIERYVQEAPLSNTQWAATAVANMRQRQIAPAVSIGSGHAGPQDYDSARPEDDHDEGSSTAPRPINIRQEVVEALATATWFIHNPKSKRVHLAGASDGALVSSDCWRTKCRRWRYGLSSHIRHLAQLEGYQQCTSCFGGDVSVPVNGESEESSSSSE